MREKKLTNMRAAGSDENVKLAPPDDLSLERAIEFIEDDELVEVTPKSIRIRKRILDEGERLKARKRAALVILSGAAHTCHRFSLTALVLSRRR